MTSHTIHPCLFPLYPAGLRVDGELIKDIHSIPDVEKRLSSLPLSWPKVVWLEGMNFLKDHQCSLQTLNRYRTELERFLLWCILVKEKNPFELSSMDIAEYVDFMAKPYSTWIGYSIKPHFNSNEVNPEWRPYVAKSRKGRIVKKKGELIKHYKPHKRSLLVAAASLSSFYTFAIDNGLCYKNPVKRARELSDHLTADSADKNFEGKRLSDEQWNILLKATEELANSKSKHERTLFLIASMKVLQLRISELSSRPVYEPTFKDFRFDGEFWWLYVRGKRNKSRLIPVPDAYLPYLKRYRKYRSLSDLPQSEDEEPIIMTIQNGPIRSKRDSKHVGLTARQLSRIVQHALDAAAMHCLERDDAQNNAVFTRATTHMLRHTGASMAVDAGVSLTHISENLGHSSLDSIQRLYVKSDKKTRATSTKYQSV